MSVPKSLPLDPRSLFASGTVLQALPRNWRDAGFRKVLGHRIPMSHLLRLLFGSDGIGALAPQALRREPTRQVGPALRQGENDLIWSGPVPAAAMQGRQGPRRVFFVVEVQSTVDRAMALRMMLYVALQALQLRSEHGIPLPVVAPIVLYTGDRPWDASLDTGELFADLLPGCVPRLRYYVADLCRLAVPEANGNLVALLAAVVRGASEEELFRAAKALHRRLAELGDEPLEGAFFELVLAQCEEKWPEENWRDCANMAELVDALEERTITWPEKWKARAIAEGRVAGIAEGIAEGRAEASSVLLSSLEKAVRARFGESVAQSFAQKTAAARDLEILDAICQCVMLSENAEKLLAGVQSIRPKTT